MKVTFTEYARKDIGEIKKYIKAEADAKIASDITGKIVLDTKRLELFPNSGLHLEDRIDRPTKFRYITTYNYATIYYVEDNMVIVAKVVHMARDFNQLQLDK